MEIILNFKFFSEIDSDIGEYSRAVHGNLCMILAIMQATADGGGGRQIAAVLKIFEDTLRYST